METPRPSEVIDFPRKDEEGKPLGRVRIMTLRMEDHDDAKQRAHAKLKKKNFSNDDIASPAIAALYGDAIAKEVIALCCWSEENYGDSENPTYARIFGDANDVSKLSADEVLVLFSAFQLVQFKYGPLEKMDPEDVDSWVKRLVEGGSGFPLLSLPLPDLVSLTSLLAEKISGVSALLATHLESLPSTLVSSLETLITDIGSYGEPASQPVTSGGASTPNVTVQDAIRFAPTLKD